MADGWGRSRSTTTTLRTFSVLGPVARRRTPAARGLAGLGTRLPSASVGLAGAAVLRRTGSAAVVGNVSIALRRGLAVGTRWDHTRYLRIGRVTRTRRDHARLTIAHHPTSARGREVATRGVVHRTVHIATRDAGGGGLLHADLVTLSDLALQLLPADLTALGERDIERLGTNHLIVHLCDGLGGFLGVGVADEPEAFGMIFFVAHDLGTGNGSERLELGAEFFIVDVVVQVLNVEVDAVILAQLLHLGMLVRFPQLFLTFGLLLCPGDENLLAIMLAIVEGINSFGSIDVGLEVDESKAFALSLGVGLEDSGSDRSELGEHFPEFFLRDLSVQVLDVDVGELFLLLVDLGHAFLIQKQLK